MLKIVESPDPMLNQVCEPCTLPDKDLAKLGKQMLQAMYANDGVGLAGPQVGVLKRIIVIDCSEKGDDPLVLINPEIIELGGELETEDEGCLSCPGISVPIERKAYARVRFFDVDGEEWEIAGDGLIGRCLQHEIDHLDGVTLFERCAPRERIKALKAYEDAKRAGAKPGETSVKAKVR